MAFEPNDMMMDLFRSEVDSHAEILTSSLLSLEQDPTNAAVLEQMMRSAHSIKGAAKIVQVTPAAEIAHVIEDCFVAAQKGELTINSNDIDVLLRGVDLMASISAATKTGTDWSPFAADVDEVTAGLQAVLALETKSSLTAPKPAATVTPAVSPEPTPSLVAAAFLDRHEAERLRRALLAAIAGDSPTIHLDLTSTTDFDAVGLAFLDAASKHLRMVKRSFEIETSPEMSRLLDIARVRLASVGG